MPRHLLSNNRFCLSNKIYFGVRSIETKNTERKKVTREVKDYSERKLQNGQANNWHKQDTHVYNNCFSFESN